MIFTRQIHLNTDRVPHREVVESYRRVIFVNLLVWRGLEMDDNCYKHCDQSHPLNLTTGLDRLHESISCSRDALCVSLLLDIKRNDALQAACYEHSESCWAYANVSESVGDGVQT